MKDKTPYLSIISPVFKAENIVDELVKRISEEASKITQNFEIILVEDGSPDQSWRKIEENCKKDSRVKGIKLSRNFGQHNAITAGLRESRGDLVVVMDCDLQDNPKYIIDLINKAKEGFDVVHAIKKSRKHGIIKNLIAHFFHKIFHYLSDDKKSPSYEFGGNFSLVSRKVVLAFLENNEYHRSYQPILRSLGFSSTHISVEHDVRYQGKSSYTFTKSMKVAVDGIVSHTDKLLRLTIYLGFIFVIIGFISSIYVFIQAIQSAPPPGWASIIIVTILCTGLIQISLGIIGIYVGKTFVQTKNRPLYLIEKKIN